MYKVVKLHLDTTEAPIWYIKIIIINHKSMNKRYNISIKRDGRWLPIGSLTHQPDKENMVINLNHISETCMAFPAEDKKPSEEDIEEMRESVE